MLRTLAACALAGAFAAVQAQIGDASSSATWRIEGTAAQAKTSLSSVSCVASAQCAAVGDSLAHGTEGLIELWNGKEWRQTTIPGLTFNGVSCVSPLDCVAVGASAQLAVGAEAEIYHWNGKSWEQVAVPSDHQGTGLGSVSCASEDDCVAVGTWAYESLGSTGIIDTWNGSQWLLQLTIRPKAFEKLDSVSCATSAYCAAVGSGTHHGGGFRQVIYTRPSAGRGWTEEAGLPPQRAELSGVSCVTSTFCVAVGTQGAINTGRHYGALIEKWNGHDWTVMPAGLPGLSRLDAVSCVSATDCVATGRAFFGGTLEKPRAVLVARWNGRDWYSEPVPSRVGYELLGVSCVASQGCLAVGANNDLTSHFTRFTALVERSGS